MTKTPEWINRGSLQLPPWNINTKAWGSVQYILNPGLVHKSCTCSFFLSFSLSFSLSFFLSFFLPSFIYFFLSFCFVHLLVFIPENRPFFLEPCGGKPADVVFLLDTSNSIWRPDFVRQLNFVKEVAYIQTIYVIHRGSGQGCDRPNIKLAKTCENLSSKDPFPQSKETFSHLIFTDLRGDKIWLKLAKISHLN